jgi:hypothetical protein
MAKAIIIDDFSTKLKSIETSDYPTVKILPEIRTVKINEVLPFRIKFTSVIIEGYGPNNIPPIPLQVIGYSNYIL